MAKQVLSGKCKGISVEGAIKELLSQVKTPNMADALITLKITEIQIRKGGIAGIEETEVKGEVSF